ncbi:BRCA1-associated protein [Dendrothele bispora CBS 962.96]|uniref:BRCA1-associated protein n=1 Tax=Dendrothele bispora (strain CBS 962.96) TaxID=1314807 RepID=A0A4S8LQN2_DENBC|nr:BRCA1-associated protein [Dendrothele bispora CBS 962.96]
MPGYHVRLVLNTRNEEKQYYIPNSLFDRLPSQTAKPTNRWNAIYNPNKKDYRFGPIRIDWFDKANMNPLTSLGKEKASGMSLTGPAVAEFIPQGTTSGSTRLPDGVVRVFRDSENASTDLNAGLVDLPILEGVVLGVLAVPSWMTPSDFLAFVAPAAENISHLRMIRDSIPNRSVVLIKFSKSEDTDEFIEAYNGKPFNSMQPELCNVVRVLSVNIDTEDTVSQGIAPFIPPQNMYELPTCPVCLERMDSAVTGLITVPCSHSFHCMCLSKWGDSRCPVCRYSQTLMSSHPASSSSTRPTPIPFANPSTPILSSCSSCSSTTNLWICLICGNIGCGRYGRAHAHSHYQSTTHLYALELETQRVWDYAGDGYVHRLIQNRADGKLVELPSAASSMGTSPRDTGLGPSPADALSAEKIEAIGIEYSYLLTSQLDSQRAYYEEQTTELQSEVGELKMMLERVTRDLEHDRRVAREAETERRKEEEARFTELAKDKARAESRAEKMTELARRLEKDLREERAVSEGLMKNLAKMKEKTETVDKDKEGLEAKINELEEQLQDLMFFLEAKDKIEQGEGIAGEAAGGSIGVSQTPGKKKKTKK